MAKVGQKKSHMLAVIIFAMYAPATSMYSHTLLIETSQLLAVGPMTKRHCDYACSDNLCHVCCN